MTGLHHVTAVTADPRRNVAFYTGTLGLRLVKRTVNFDAPDTWHLYYGGRTGRPGTTLTFFAWPDLPPGRAGPGQATAVSFAVPARSLPYWARRLEGRGVEAEPCETAGGRRALSLSDPDGLRLRLVGVDDPAGEAPGAGSPVPEEHAVRGFHDVVLAVREAGPTAAVLDEVLGFRRREAAGGGRLLVADGSGPGRRVEVTERADGAGRGGAGTVHHVAFRAADDQEQEKLRAALAGRGLSPTPPIDRHYFRSVYAREPGGVLFEIATDGPGFTRDEEASELGRELALPPWLESRRRTIEEGLPPLGEAGGSG